MQKSSSPKTALFTLTLAALLAGAASCKKPPAELAPVKVGDWWEYKFTIAAGNAESSYQAKFLVEPGEDAQSFTLNSIPDAKEKPAPVDAALDAGKPIKQHFLGQLWLPPAHRQIGFVTRIGTVKEQRPKWNHWAVWVVDGAATAKGQYFFEQNTGFLVGANIPASDGTHSSMMLSSSIAGL